MKHRTTIRIAFLALCACVMALVIHITPVYNVYEEPHLQSLQNYGKWKRIELEHPVEFGTKPAPDAAVVADDFWIPKELVMVCAKSSLTGWRYMDEKFPFSELDMQYLNAIGLSKMAVLYCEAERQGITVDDTEIKTAMWKRQAEKRWAVSNDYSEDELAAKLNGMQMTVEEYIVSEDEIMRKQVRWVAMEDRWYEEFWAEQSQVLSDTYNQYTAITSDEWKEELQNRMGACFLAQHVQCHLGDE